MRSPKKGLCALVALALAPLGVVSLPSGALADEVPTPGIYSPALASTNDNPTVVDGKTVPLDPRPGFRVLPYLQRPSDTGITINWFTELGHDAKLTVTGPGLPPTGLVKTVKGVHNPVNDYQDYELTQGDLTRKKALKVAQGAWIRADKPFKYSIDLDGLTADSTYQYKVEVDGYEHAADFSTLPAAGSKLTKPIHIIAFSDTETDPIGRVTYREWEQTLNLAEGSEDRPGEGSTWDEKFGGSTRNGKYAVNYALTEDQAQEINNAAIADADPDLLLLPGDIAERASSQTHWDEWFRYFAGDKGHPLDSIPVITSLGNHEVYGYGTPDDRTSVIRARAAYNQVFDTHGSDNADARDAYHRTDYGPITFISLDSTNGQPDQSPESAEAKKQKGDPNYQPLPAPADMKGNDANITEEQLGTDTQNQFTMEEIRRDFPKTVESGWWGEGQDPNSVDQPDFMPGSDQYKWLEAQLKDARSKGQTIVVQYHHVAYSNGTHGTTMGHEFSDLQPGTPMRHLEPLFEKYQVASVFSGHDEMFQASYVDEDGDGVGIYHWDVGVASDGLRGEKMVKNENGEYVPLRFNSHSIWMAQADEPEMWKTNKNGVKHLVSGGKHYGHLDIKIAPYEGQPLASGKMPAATMVMTPISLFPVLDDNYDLDHVERRVLESGIQTVYLDENGAPLPVKAADDDDTDQGEGVNRFSMAVLPDTQFYSRYSTESSGNQFGAMYGSEPYDSQTQWIVDNADALGLKLTMHLGDVVDQVNHDDQWAIASKAMKKLEAAGQPYSILAGNHDVGRTAEEEGLSADYTIYKNIFSSERAAKNSTFIERDPSGAHEAHLVNVDGTQFLVLNLSWAADAKAFEWAQGILDRYKTTPTILNSHQLINVEGDGVTPLRTDFGEKVWNELIKNNDQVFLTFNGHHHGATKWERTNEFGHPVYQVLMDYQMAYMGGNGYMGVVEFDLANGKIHQTTFSPWVPQKPKDTLVPDDQAKLTGDNQTFTIDFDFAARFPELKIGQKPATEKSATEQLNAWLDTFEEPSAKDTQPAQDADDYQKVEGAVAHWKMPTDLTEGQTVPVGYEIEDATDPANNFTRAPLNEGSVTNAQESDVTWTANHHPLSANSGAMCFSGAGRDDNNASYFMTAEGAPINAETFPNGFTFETFVSISSEFDNENNAWMQWLTRDGQRQNIKGYAGTEGEEPPFAWAFSNLAEVQFSFTDGQNPPAESSAWSGEIVKRDQWMHLVVVNDPETKTATMYVDGVPVLRNSTDVVGVGTEGLPWVLGAGSYAGQRQSGFVGCIGETRLVDHPIAQSQWLTARASDVPAPEPTPEPTWPQVGNVYVRDSLSTGVANSIFGYGDTGEDVFFGDWDGDGVATPGVKRGNAFLLRKQNTPGVADIVFTYGNPTDSFVVGDFDGDGVDTIAVQRGNKFFVKNSLKTGKADFDFMYGDSNDVAIAGDFDGDDVDTIAVQRGNKFFVKNSLKTGKADFDFMYGDSNDVAIAGDFDGDGVDTIAVQRGNKFFVKNSLKTGKADFSFAYGDNGDFGSIAIFGKGVGVAISR
ncbi:metallophosphoesterase [Actinobaculum massiliense]|uniref:metallophosphoesterase n=1 Tax=Actinobaculum massiliense TaxID=202789 RepID=UPI000B3019F4|nr:metallophosphoesterase [Actinobaculum massiliense]